MAIKSQLPETWRGSRGISNPIREMSRLQRRLDRMFDEFFSEPSASFLGSPANLWGSQTALEEYAPACDVEETGSLYLLNLDLPGLKKEDVKIEIQDNTLTVSGERKREQEDEVKDKGHWARERFHGTFIRSLTLPSNVNSEKVEARYDNGVLQIAIPKTAAAAGKQIPVKEGKLIEAKSGKAA